MTRQPLLGMIKRLKIKLNSLNEKLADCEDPMEMFFTMKIRKIMEI